MWQVARKGKVGEAEHIMPPPLEKTVEASPKRMNSLTWIWFIQAKKYKKTYWPHSLPWYRSKLIP